MQSSGRSRGASSTRSSGALDANPPSASSRPSSSTGANTGIRALEHNMTRANLGAASSVENHALTGFDIGGGQGDAAVAVVQSLEINKVRQLRQQRFQVEQRWSLTDARAWR